MTTILQAWLPLLLPFIVGYLARHFDTKLLALHKPTMQQAIKQLRLIVAEHVKNEAVKTDIEAVLDALRDPPQQPPAQPTAPPNATK